VKQLTLSQPLVVRWHYDSEQTLNFTPATDGNKFFLPLGGGTIVSLNAVDGRLRWKSDTGGEISASQRLTTRKSMSHPSMVILPAPAA